MEDQINSIKDKIESILQSLDSDDSHSGKLNGLLDSLLKTKSLLDDDSYSVVFISPPGVGKTTAICHLLDLKDENGEPCLSTSSGRTTVCETEIRKSENTELKLEPIREEEILYYLDAFVEKIKHSCTAAGDTGNVASPLPAEIERCIRNFTRLRPRVIRKNKEGSKSEIPDEAVNLFQNECNHDEISFREKCLERMNLESRKKTSLACNEENDMSWLKKTFHEINLGKNPETSIPAKVIVGIKRSLLQDLESDVSIIDTMGIDGNVRKDIDDHLKDPRSVIVLCTRFNDAPEEAVRKLLQHIKDCNWHRSVFPRCLILVLDRNDEAKDVIDDSGESVGDVENGRFIKESQIIDNLRQINDQEFKLLFYDSKIEKSDNLHRELLENISSFKISSQEQISEIGNAVKEIEKWDEDKKVKAASRLLFDLYKEWLGKCQETRADFDKFYKPMLSHMNGPLHASTLRGSVNRSGSFINFDFYYTLESEARKKAVSFYQDHIYQLISTLETVRETEAYKPVSYNIKILLEETNEQLNKIAALAAKMGREIYEEFLKNDESFWAKQRAEWGRGTGYKSRVVFRTDGWLEQQKIADSDINREIDKRWKEFLQKMDSFLNQNGH